MNKSVFTLPTPDSLQNALLYLVVVHYKKQISLASLTSGLPLEQGRLTAQLFIRAAQRAGIAAKVVDRAPADILPQTLPAVVYLKDGTFAILQEINAEGQYNVLNMTRGNWQVYKNAEHFTQDYGGFTILTKVAPVQDRMRDSFIKGTDWFWTTVKQFKKLYVQVALAAGLINLMALVSPLFVMNVYDRVVPNAAYETLWVLALGVFIAYSFDFIFRQLRAYFVDTAGRGADILLASRIYEQVLNARLGTRQSSAGAFANQLREFETLRDFLTSGTLVTLIDLPFVLIFLTIIMLIGGPIALVPLVAIPIVLFVCYFVQLPLQAIVLRSSNDMDNKHGHLVETINGLEVIKAMGTQSSAQHKWEQFTAQLARQGARSRFLAQLGTNFSLYAQQIVSMFVIVIGVYLITAGELSMGGLIACNMLASRTMAPLGQVVALYVRFQQAWMSMTNLNKIMNLPVERAENQSFVHVDNLKGEIAFQDVTFAYPGAKIESLNQINFHIKPGERVGVIGRAGSGKSTLSRLLLNLYLPSSGSILLDGLEIRQLDPAEFRQHIAYVPQNNRLFRGTLRENILMANPHATDADLVRAAEMSGVIDFARRHPMGFDMPVGELGEGLSSGQRQAVGLARGIIRQSDIVVLDDPTSEMDNRGEDKVAQYMKEWTKNRTLVLITHRAVLMELVDRLIVMDYGKIIADGSKDQVLSALRAGQIKGVQR